MYDKLTFASYSEYMLSSGKDSQKQTIVSTHSQEYNEEEIMENKDQFQLE